MIRRNLLKFLCALPLVTCINPKEVFAKELFGDGEIVRINVDEKDLKYTDSIYSPTGDYYFNAPYLCCDLYNHKYPHLVDLTYPVRMHKRESLELSEKEILNLTGAITDGRYLYYHVVTCNDLCGYHIADSLLSKVKP